MDLILLIEDDSDQRENLSEILSLNGYGVITAANGKTGVETALREKPDLILCDVMMPDLDGFGVLQILGNNHKTADIPFIYLSAKSENEDFRRGMSLGADDYILKPFDVTHLLQTVERRLHKSRRLKQAAQNHSFEGFVNEAKALEMLHHLSDNRELRHYRKKEVLYKEGDHPRYLFYIETGAVKVFKSNELGQEFIVRIAGKGDFLGYLSLQKSDRYTETAAVLEASDVRLIPHEDFHALLFGNRDVNAQFIKLLAGQVADQEQMLLELAYNSVRKRVAAALINLHDQGINTIHFQRDDLAAVVGTAKETLVRTISSFKTEGLVAVNNGEIKLLKPEKLRVMPN